MLRPDCFPDFQRSSCQEEGGGGLAQTELRFYGGRKEERETSALPGPGPLRRAAQASPGECQVWIRRLLDTAAGAGGRAEVAMTPFVPHSPAFPGARGPRRVGRTARLCAVPPWSLCRRRPRPFVSFRGTASSPWTRPDSAVGSILCSDYLRRLQVSFCCCF